MYNRNVTLRLSSGYGHVDVYSTRVGEKFLESRLSWTKMSRSCKKKKLSV